METERSEHRCPRCGSRLLHDGKKYWCSFVGGGREKACSFGIDQPVTTADTLVWAYMERDGMDQREAEQLAASVRGVLA